MCTNVLELASTTDDEITPANAADTVRSFPDIQATPPTLSNTSNRIPFSQKQLPLPHRPLVQDSRPFIFALHGPIFPFGMCRWFLFMRGHLITASQPSLCLLCFVTSSGIVYCTRLFALHDLLRDRSVVVTSQ